MRPSFLNGRSYTLAIEISTLMKDLSEYLCNDLDAVVAENIHDEHGDASAFCIAYRFRKPATELKLVFRIVIGKCSSRHSAKTVGSAIVMNTSL